MQYLTSIDGKTIGALDGGIWIKKVKASVHFLRKPPAIAFDANEVDRQMAKFAVTGFRVIDTETGDTYSLHRETWDDHSKTTDRGFGRQYFVLLSLWTKTQPGQPLPELTGRAGQASLF